MGNSESTNAVPLSTPNFAPQVEVLKKVNNPHYGDIKLVKDLRTGEEMILKEVSASTKEAFEQEAAQHDKRVTNAHPNLVRIFGFTSQDKQNFCSTYYKLSIYIEVVGRDLETELNERIAANTSYSEGDLLLIAENLASGLTYFQSNNVAHRDVRPYNIFVTSGYTYKLSDPFLHPLKTNGLANAILQTAKSLLAPELITQVPLQNFDAKVDFVKADAYSLGLTLLGLATLTNSEDLFNYETGTINADELNNRLQKVKESYSNFTFETIEKLLTPEPDDRLDFIALSNRLSPYQDEIRRRIELPFYKNRTHEGTQEVHIESVENSHGQHESPHKATHVHSAAPEEKPVHVKDEKFEQKGDNTTADEALLRASQQLAKSQQLRAEGAAVTTTNYTSYTPATYDTDDLDARIRAALERSQQTFKQIFEGGSTTTNYGTTDYTSSYQPGNYGTTDYSSYTSNYATTTNYTPIDYSSYGNYGTTTTTTTAPVAEPQKVEEKPKEEPPKKEEVKVEEKEKSLLEKVVEVVETVAVKVEEKFENKEQKELAADKNVEPVKHDNPETQPEKPINAESPSHEHKEHHVEQHVHHEEHHVHHDDKHHDEKHEKNENPEVTANQGTA